MAFPQNTLSLHRYAGNRHGSRWPKTLKLLVARLPDASSKFGHTGLANAATLFRDRIELDTDRPSLRAGVESH
jgi:hypothetical protein